ncbi:MAG: hypothetical protein KatS3mg121_0257 [Gammaproteobacteria bacterium]|nr:MAG: hypothetical protein KatS3mg121_0257 [Gammaproteobacteria bacterium]
MFNQAVLLAGVNDDVDTQAALCERLFDIGVIPYYLHMLDPVEGAHHFAVDPRRALRIMSGLQSRLPRLSAAAPGSGGRRRRRQNPALAGGRPRFGHHHPPSEDDAWRLKRPCAC